MKELEDFLRENKPAVQDDPTFLLETRKRMDAVEGIKAEVDHQRSHGRVVVIVTLAIGVAVGMLAMALAFLFPAVPAREGIWQSIRLFLDSWKQYLMFPVAALAILLGIVLSGPVRITGTSRHSLL